ncbi:unnamed protein product [Dibothriocephalus latus]|uniref:Uncharacterized protein n=1 Tax=Dibothriocephalus latus TaxID=60516 RepID=A0A3P7LT42_DIBLA|nr:unnamed protein product [Dibothriocephalus latus]
MYAARSRYHDMMGSVKDFIKTHNVPQDLAERVIDYVTSTWAITKGIDTAKVDFRQVIYTFSAPFQLTVIIIYDVPTVYSNKRVVVF